MALRIICQRAKITTLAINKAWRKRAPDVRTVINDTECGGLALVVNARSMAWRYSYRPHGHNPETGKRLPSGSVNIGPPATYSPAEARQEALRLKGAVAAGRDPSSERKVRLLATVAARSLVVEKLVADYAQALPLRRRLRGPGTISPRFAAEEIAHLKAAVAVMSAPSKPIAEINAADLRALLRADPHEPNSARHRFNALRRFFDWARDEGVLAANPCEAIPRARRPRPPASRAHYPSLAQCAALWRAAESLPAAWRDFVRFLIAVPCRRGEAASLDWAHVDLAAAVWSQPAKLTKNREPHRLHLHSLALDLLAARYEAAGRPASGLVFPAPRSAQQIVAFSSIARALRAAAPELAEMRLHDLRRSFASVLGETGVSETIADAILNHRQAATRSGVLGVYQRSARFPEQVAAMQHWGRLLEDALTGRPPEAAEVIPIARRPGRA
jgi:integrase